LNSAPKERQQEAKGRDLFYEALRCRMTLI